jgi:putative ABC transport system permease protein
MQIFPILASLRHNKAGALLVSLQIAVTLAVLCNTMSIIQQHLAAMRRPSGVDEANILTVRNQFVDESSDLKARMETDLTALRSIPGVVDVEATPTYPLGGRGWSTDVHMQPGQRNAVTISNLYFVDEHALDALGVKLVAGRWFRPDDVRDMRVNDTFKPATTVITQTLAKQLFPKGDALGQTIYLFADDPISVVGIIDRAQAPWADFGSDGDGPQRTSFVPVRIVDQPTYYVVRARPGQLAALLRAVPDRLYAISPSRIVDQVLTLSASRQKIYNRAHASSLILEVISGLLLATTALGVIGLTTYWVGQRRRYIGIRRALGARRADIVRYFHIENLLIAGLGAAVGVGLTILANLYLVSHLEISRVGLVYVGIAAAIVLVLSQLSVLWPALRASAIPPAIATRGL